MLGVVCHDAGGAEVVSSWLKAEGVSFVACLAGPAVAIFYKRFPSLISRSLEQVIEQCDHLLCGTSWQSTLEISAIKMAKDQRKKTVAYLDHWVNYKERFVSRKENLECFPDVIWVGDKDAYVIAKQVFPSLEIILVPNYFFAEIQSEVRRFSEGKALRSWPRNSAKVLFVCEPIALHALKQYGDPCHFGYDEFDALDYFFSNLNRLDLSVNQIDIRPHPSESEEKYSWLECHSQQLKVAVNNEPPIFDHILSADIVVGCESMALVLGLLANKKVISVIPPGGEPCVLPQKEILHLKDFNDES